MTKQLFCGLAIAAVAMATLLLASTSGQAASISATGWERDYILGSGETHAAHDKPENANIWFADNVGITPGGIPASGAVSAGGFDFQYEPFTGGANNGVRGPGTLTLVTPAKYSEIALLASNTGGSSSDVWQITLNFSDGPSSAPINYSGIQNWAGTAGDLNPKLTGNGSTSAYGGALTVQSFDLDGLGFAGNTLTSIDFTGGSGNAAIFALSGVVVPEPSAFVLAALGVLGLMTCSRRRRR